jgi:Ni,Fe-hydrogenase III large subunit/NADH:ubiquinone oxidoreductase subunit C
LGIYPNDMKKYLTIVNNQTVPLQSIPVLSYTEFLELNTKMVQKSECHCVNYYGFLREGRIKLICCIANDAEHVIHISSSEMEQNNLDPKSSFSAQHLSFHIYERELHENFGIRYSNHPWLKPVRYPFDRTYPDNKIENYPFYQVHSEELHEVGVGPIHAGIIEPGHFRFICNGEQILHLEIQMGYQHRGLERLFVDKRKLLQRITLAENIAGDTVVGHSTAFVNVWESLAGFSPSHDLLFARTLALEIERLAIHTGNLSAICTDIAYQLGSSVFGRLRTPLINFMQEWCGNRLSKGLIRVGKNNYFFTRELAEKLTELLDSFTPDFLEMYEEMKSLPTVLARLERTGVVTRQQAESIGTVGMTARTSGISRDIRRSHPFGLFMNMDHEPVVKHHGDVYSRIHLRKDEILQSIGYIRQWIQNIPGDEIQIQTLKKPEPDAFSIALVEGWRGEICHCAVTDSNGELMHYKIKDPSLHNWLALALSVRNNEISDFPVCNKSFDLSYCGQDL